MSKLNLENLNTLAGFVGAALVDSDSGMAMVTTGGGSIMPTIVGGVMASGSRFGEGSSLCAKVSASAAKWAPNTKPNTPACCRHALRI